MKQIAETHLILDQNYQLILRKHRFDDQGN